MSSTKPITSAKEEPERRVLGARLLTAAAVGALALVVAFGAGRAAIAASERVHGQAALLRVALIERSGERDRALFELQQHLDVAIRRMPDDPTLWGQLAETRLLQATSAQAREVSPGLIAAAAEAGERQAELLAPDGAALARLALIYSLMNDAEQRADSALAQAFEKASFTDGLASERRLRAAARRWDRLETKTRTAAWLEMCGLRRAGGEEELLQIGVDYADVGYVSALRRLIEDPACAVSVTDGQ